MIPTPGTESATGRLFEVNPEGEVVWEYILPWFAEYPDARVIWTHRDPFTATGSLCSIISLSHMGHMGRIDAELHGADDTGPTALPPPTGLPGRNGARCFATQIGPIPGPPPPCGMQNVLCRFR